MIKFFFKWRIAVLHSDKYPMKLQGIYIKLNWQNSLGNMLETPNLFCEDSGNFMAKKKNKKKKSLSLSILFWLGERNL